MAIQIVKPWQGSGEDIQGAISVGEVMAKARLDWRVEGRPLYYPQGSADNVVQFEKSNTHKAIIQVGTERELGIVGVKWNILQNGDVFEFVDSLVRLGLVKYTAAGQFKHGQVVYVMAEFQESEILPGDVHKKYLLFTNAYDGTYSVRIGWTDIRVICWNTFMMAANEAKANGFSIRHTVSMKDKIEVARNALIAAEEQSRVSEMFMKALTRLNMTSDMWKQFGEAIVPPPKEGANKTRSDNIRSEVLSLALTGIGQDIPGVAGTAYAAFNGLTEYVNYHRSSRGDDELTQQANRFNSTLFGSGGKLINQGIRVLGGFLTEAGIQVDTVA